MKRPIEFKGQSGFQGPIIDWYKTLRITKVCNLEVRKSTGSKLGFVPVVIASLVDGSKYRLQRSISKSDPIIPIIPTFIDTIEHILPSDIDSSSQLLVSIKFNEGAQPDLLFILSVCYGARTQGVIFTAPQIVIDSDFFVVALILIVTRKYLPIDVVSQPPDASPVQSLWTDAYTLIQGQGYAFWLDTVAEYTKNITREIIYRAARGAIAPGMSWSDISSDLSLAAAAVARVETLAERKELVDPAVWDEAWNNRWQAVWQRSRATDVRGTTPVLSAIQGIPWKAPSIDSRVVGRAAGRSPVRFPLHPNDPGRDATWFHSIALIPQPPMKSIQKGKAKEDQLEAVPMDNIAPEESDSSEALVAGKSTTQTRDTLDKPDVWLARMRLNRRGESEIWAPPKEIAVEMAWISAWGKAVEAGKAAAAKIQDLERGDHPLQLGLQETPRRRRATSVHPGLAGPIAAARHTSDLLVRASKRMSVAIEKAIAETPVPASPRVRMSQTVDPRIRTCGESAPASPRPRSERISFQAPPTFEVPDRPKFEVVSRPKSHSHSSSGTGTHREHTRTLRRHVVSRHSDYRRRSDLEDLSKFIETVRERRHREKKEDAQLLGGTLLTPVTRSKAKVPLDELATRVDNAWSHAMHLSDNQMKKQIEDLAEQEWWSILASLGLPPLLINPRWKERFGDTWENAWKESWLAAWSAVWDHAWSRAAAKGVEFGIEEVLDLDPNSSARKNYKILQSSASYHAIEDNIKKNCPDNMHRLGLTHSMMAELYSLYESFRHSIPNIRDDRIEIVVFTTKITKPKGVAGRFKIREESIPSLVSYFQLQNWVEEQHIAPKFKGDDSELHAKLMRLFKRGISEVWDSAASVYKEEETSSQREGSSS